jgi:hypothetical protein
MAGRPPRAPILLSLSEVEDRTRAPLVSLGTYSTVTLFARLRGWSTSVPLSTAIW